MLLLRSNLQAMHQGPVSWLSACCSSKLQALLLQGSDLTSIWSNAVMTDIILLRLEDKINNIAWLFETSQLSVRNEN